MSMPSPRWLTLSQAAQLLGVHPTTLRRWADDGAIRCHRTPGGHRRFLERELRAFMNTMEESEPTTDLAPSAVYTNLIQHTRHEMEVQQISSEPWYATINDDDRDVYREQGQRLLGLAIQYTLRSSGREAIVEEGRRIGRLYGQRAAKQHIPLASTTRALLFFRETLIRAARPGLLNQGRYDAEEVQIHRSLREFLDQVLFAAMEGYEETIYVVLNEGEVA